MKKLDVVQKDFRKVYLSEIDGFLNIPRGTFSYRDRGKERPMWFQRLVGFRKSPVEYHTDGKDHFLAASCYNFRQYM